MVVAMISSWGFAYYWPHGEPAIEPVASNLQQFITVFPDQPNILVATAGTSEAVDDVMSRAVARATGPEGNKRIWFVHDHVRPSELADFRAWAASEGPGRSPRRFRTAQSCSPFRIVPDQGSGCQDGAARGVTCRRATSGASNSTSGIGAAGSARTATTAGADRICCSSAISSSAHGSHDMPRR